MFSVYIFCLEEIDEDQGVKIYGCAFCDESYTEDIPTSLAGDINMDGIVNTNDAILLLRHSLLPDKYPVAYSGNLDLTGDGLLNSEDAILLLRYSLLPDKYPIN